MLYFAVRGQSVREELWCGKMAAEVPLQGSIQKRSQDRIDAGEWKSSSTKVVANLLLLDIFSKS